MNTFKEKMAEYASEVDKALVLHLNGIKKKNNPLKEAITYSLLSGGKRVRGVLALSTMEMLGGDKQTAMKFATAIEMIHCYSLIHDDLPAMDNDDYRRGKLSNHKVFGEGQAILAGDALLSESFCVLLSAVKDEHTLQAVKFIADCCGIRGMVGGQSSDLYMEGKEQTLEDYEYITHNKTARLIIAPIISASLACGGKCFDNLYVYADSIGKLFQVTDDILDVESTAEVLGKTVGKDEKENKLTAIKIYGLEGAKKHAEKLYNDAVNSISHLDTAGFLIDFAKYVYNRKK